MVTIMNSTEAAHDKYEAKPFLGSSHSWASSRLASYFASQTKTGATLDIGPGSGVIGKILKELGFTESYAVEVDPESRQLLTPLYTEIHSSLEPLKNKKFKVILLLDVLEHMSEPEQFFLTAYSMLEVGGVILISVPNIAHWSVRFPLLFGFFEYTRRGILDRTHLQMFTKRRLKRMINSASALETIEFAASIEPLELILPKFIWDNEAFRTVSALREWASNLLPGLLAYQHLAMVQRKQN